MLQVSICAGECHQAHGIVGEEFKPTCQVEVRPRGHELAIELVKQHAGSIVDSLLERRHRVRERKVQGDVLLHLSIACIVLRSEDGEEHAVSGPRPEGAVHLALRSSDDFRINKRE